MMSTEIGNWGVPPASRPATVCDRHPNEPVTGFCASCLRERLAGLEPNAAADAPRKSTSSLLKSIFSRNSNANANSSLHSSSFRRSELRRSKSFSVSRFPRVAAACEPQRKSCDVRTRNTLLALFHQDDVRRPSISLSVAGDVEEQSPKFSVPEIEGREDSDEIMSVAEEIDDDDTEITAKKIPAKEFSGSFWLAASVFSKKLRNWRTRKLKTQPPPSTMPPEKQTGDTQSDVAVDAFGRRSFDVNPRFSLDIPRVSYDDPRYSWDEPRVSWDGYLVGGRSALPRLPPMLAVAEDSPTVAVQRFDALIPVEDDFQIPGGSSQTKDYYENPSSRGRRSLDRSNSARKSSFEMMKVPNPGELVQPYRGGKHERDSREWSSNSLKDECLEALEFASRDRSKIPPAKKSRRWNKAWSFFGFIHRRGRNGGNRGDVMERCFSETWPGVIASECNGGIRRSNSTVCSRSLSKGNGEFGRSVKESRKKKKKKKMEEFDNGLLGLYLPGLKGSRRTGKYSSPHSFTGSMLSLY